jgi:hypothetical protein
MMGAAETGGAMRKSPMAVIEIDPPSAMILLQTMM